jgi:DNA-binding NtrC family response regulator
MGAPKRRAILHVDDDPQITRLMSERLRLCDFDVYSLNDPRRALDELIHHQYRVVLTDIDMPGLDGVQLLKEIKRYDGGIQVLMFTSIVNVSTVLAAFRGGAEACFFKPMADIEPLVHALDDAFHKIDRWWDTLQNLSQQRHSIDVAEAAHR